ncbi:hypothetical protein Acr_00g0088310 [Actinidia rufa]|uniref:PPC domain-containing protein n=1 Tax=Actinidia rufa TaxID=165716 RepID=A0A7J0DXJ7_9ERIC|nr:hypothetical protein Acr_00g0088310 [Actinidia rufa]
MSPYVLEISAGADLIEAIHRFSRKRNLGICVLSASGAVSNVTLRQPSVTPGTTVTFHGRFDLLSLSATVMPATTSIPLGNEFAISMAGPQGQIIGGIVVEPLYAGGDGALDRGVVYQTVVSQAISGGREEFGGKRGELAATAGDSRPRWTSSAVTDAAAAAAESCGMSLYSGHLGSDVIWAPTARQPPPHY